MFLSVILGAVSTCTVCASILGIGVTGGGICAIASTTSERDTKSPTKPQDLANKLRTPYDYTRNKI